MKPIASVKPTGGRNQKTQSLLCTITSEQERMSQPFLTRSLDLFMTSKLYQQVGKRKEIYHYKFANSRWLTIGQVHSSKYVFCPTRLKYAHARAKLCYKNALEASNGDTIIILEKFST